MITPAPRKALQLPVKLVFGDSKKAVAGRSVNLSETGMLILSGAERPRGTTLRFEFPAFKGRGEVIWTKAAEDEIPPGSLLGIKFSSLSGRARRQLSDLLSPLD